MPQTPEDLDIVVTGFEVEQGRAEAGLMRVFGLDSDRARSFVQQLPIVAKRCREREAAERYARALRSIGARIELRPHVEPRPGSPASERTSLPAPSNKYGPPESLRAASDRAVARFRAEEGLDDPRFTPSGLDLYNPRIPKAPALPRDLRQMPNGPRSGAPAQSKAQPAPSSDPPEWVVSDPLALTPKPDGKLPDGLRPLGDDEIRLAPSSSRPPPQSGERLSDRPRSVGLAHSATASGRPGLSASRFSLGSSLTPSRRRFARVFAIVMSVIAAGLLWARATGHLLSDDERLVRTWREHGIDPGDHAAARPWLAEDGQARRVHGFDREALDRFFTKLDRAGAPQVYAIRIQAVEGGGEEASALLIEMPGDKATRRTLLWHLAAARGKGDAPLLDDDKPFQVLELP